MSIEELRIMDDRNKHNRLDIINTRWRSKAINRQATLADIASVYKKGDPNNMENYRPISLLSTIYKICASLVKRRLEQGIEKELQPTQYGFRKGRSTSSAIAVIRRIQDLAEHSGK